MSGKSLPLLILIFLATQAIGQKDGVYYRYSSAFEHPDSVRVIDINCLHNNFYRTDGCEIIPINIDIFKNLTELHLSETDVQVFPNAIANLLNLKTLALFNNWNLDYETELCKIAGLEKLESLELSMMNMERLPSCLSKLKSLKAIDLSYNYNDNLNIERVFSILIRLPNLEKLDLGGIHGLHVIPETVQEIRNLKTISLSSLRKEFDFQSSFARLSFVNIRSLDLSENSLKDLPENIQSMQSIETLNLSDNIFSNVPTPVLELPNLKELYLNGNEWTFTGISEAIVKLQNLEKLNLSGNYLTAWNTTIPNISKLPHLKELYLGSCRMDTIPEELKNFKALEELYLGGNPNINFRDLFIKLSQVTSLRYLDLSDNKLTQLPKEIGLLTNLEYLVLGQNPISYLPEEFFQLKNLKVLYVYGNFGTRVEESEIEKVRNRLPNCQINREWMFGR